MAQVRYTGQAPESQRAQTMVNAPYSVGVREQDTSNRDDRIALFGSDYVKLHERGAQSNERDSETANSINHLEEQSARIAAMVEQSLRNQQNIAQGVSDVQQGVGKLQTCQERVGSQIDNFRRKALAGIGVLADNGGSWLDNCFPPRTKRAAVSCLKDLILLFVQLYIFLAFTWFNLCRSVIGITGTIGAATPVVGGIVRPIVQGGMIIFLLWISTFVLTLFAFNTMSGMDQIINIIYLIRQFMKFIFRNIQSQLSNMRSDMLKIADKSGLNDDYKQIREQTDGAAAEMGTWVRGELANATANAVRNLPGATLNTIRNVGATVGDAARATPGAVVDAARAAPGAVRDVARGAVRGVGGMVANMFGSNSGHTELGGGKKSSKSHKRKRGKRTGRTRKSRGGTKEGDFIRINELTNEVLKETGIFTKYILAVYHEITFLYLHDKVSDKDRAELDELFKKNPIELKFDHPLVKMLSKTTSGILTNVGSDALDGDFKVNYVPLAKFYNEIGDKKGGKRRRTKGKRRKTKRNRKRKLRKTLRN